MKTLLLTVGILLTLLSEISSLEISKEVYQDTYVIPALNKHIHLDNIFRHRLGVFTGDYYNQRRLNGETLEEQKRTQWSDDFFSFMWLPQEVGILGDYAIFASNQRNQSPPPVCAIIKYNLNEMYPHVGRFDALTFDSTKTQGFYNVLIDSVSATGYVVGDGQVISFNANGTYSTFAVKEKLSFRSQYSYNQAALSSDGSSIFLTNDNQLEVFSLKEKEIVASLNSPGDARKGSLVRLAVDSAVKYAYAISYRAYIREFPNTTYECFIIKYDLQNLQILASEPFEACFGADLYAGFGFVEPNGRYAFFGASTERRIADTDSIVKVDTQTLKIVERLDTKYELNHVVYDRNNQALAVGTLKGTEMEDQYALVINL